MRSPFKFLDAFELKDKDVFFGRAEETDALYNMVFKTPLLLVYGLSGTGKTSLIQCGLAGRFTGPNWFPFYIRRGDDLNASLRKAFVPVIPAGMAPPENLKDTVSLLFRYYLRPVYLIFDQFEELFILGSREEQSAFAGAIWELLAAELPCKIIFAMREEFIGQLYYLEKEIPSIYDFRLRVEPMGFKKVQEVIAGSFKAFNITLDEPERNTEHIYNNISAGKSGVQLPYLQVYLDMLWREDYVRTFGPDAADAGWEGNAYPALQLTTKEIEDFGAIEDVLARFLREQETELLAALRKDDPTLPANTVRQILDAFVTEEGTKRPARFSRDGKAIVLEESVAQLLPALPETALHFALGRLEAARLLRERDGALELAHDALATLIDRERSEEQRTLNELKNRLNNALREFHFSEGTVYPGKKLLLDVEEKRDALQMTQELDDFYEKGRTEAGRLENAEKERGARELRLVEEKLAAEKRARKRQRLFIWLVVGVAMLAIGSLSLATVQQIELQKTTEKVVNSLLHDADIQIYHLRYDDAWNKIEDAAQLGVKKVETARALMEIAFFYIESGGLKNAQLATEHTARLFEKINLAEQIKNLDTLNVQNMRHVLSSSLQAFDPERYSDLQTRYYPNMILLEGGEAEVDHKKTQINTFKIAQTETTFWQFALYAADTRRKFQDFSPSWGLDGDNPVVNVSWYDAALYANWLSKKFGLDLVYTLTNEREITDSILGKSIGYDVEIDAMAKGFLLPSEIEWEYAARSGLGQDAFMYSGTIDHLSDFAWYDNNSDTLGVKRTHPVSTRKANCLGLYDMTGNVWEWCWDWFTKYPDTFPTNYHGAITGEDRVLRGGCWNDNQQTCRVSYRLSGKPQIRHNDVGFRLILSISSAERAKR